MEVKLIHTPCLDLLVGLFGSLDEGSWLCLGRGCEAQNSVFWCQLDILSHVSTREKEECAGCYADFVSELSVCLWHCFEPDNVCK